MNVNDQSLELIMNETVVTILLLNVNQWQSPLYYLVLRRLTVYFYKIFNFKPPSLLKEHSLYYITYLLVNLQLLWKIYIPGTFERSENAVPCVLVANVCFALKTTSSFTSIHYFIWMNSCRTLSEFMSSWVYTHNEKEEYCDQQDTPTM